MRPESTHQLLFNGFLESSDTFPDRPAIEVGGRAVSYGNLRQTALALAATIRRYLPAGGAPLTAVFAYRSESAFAGVLGALLAGHGYVPLNLNFPVDRTRLMLQRSECRSVIVDPASALQLDQLLVGIDSPLLLIMPETTEAVELAERWPQHRFVTAGELEDPQTWTAPQSTSPNSVAYLLFTSGSTGKPKGVMVAHRNVRHYIDFMVTHYQMTHEDRVSQTFDMTFDVSVHDMFVAWECGACVCCPDRKTLIKPGRFINDSRLTIWFSVPSVAMFMEKLGMLKPGMYPNLRLSLFAGEALPMHLVQSWEIAAPNCAIENVYGPTELTVTCTYYRWDPEKSPAECENGLVPIGYVFPGMEIRVVDEALHPVDAGCDGELIMAGPQVTIGYLNDPGRTNQSFVTPPGETQIFYRTGDRVRHIPGKPIPYLGRLDQQMKILGNRVELGEVEAAVRQESGLSGAVAIGWPINPGGADGIEVFVQAAGIDAASLRERLSARLPSYMVPRHVHALEELPLNSNGKVDRHALLAILQRNSA